jgi:hypothetical protein
MAKKNKAELKLGATVHLKAQSAEIVDVRRPCVQHSGKYGGG